MFYRVSTCKQYNLLYKLIGIYVLTSASSAEHLHRAVFYVLELYLQECVTSKQLSKKKK